MSTKLEKDVASLLAADKSIQNFVDEVLLLNVGKLTLGQVRVLRSKMRVLAAKDSMNPQIVQALLQVAEGFLISILDSAITLEEWGMLLSPDASDQALDEYNFSETLKLLRKNPDISRKDLVRLMRKEAVTRLVNEIRDDVQGEQAKLGEAYLSEFIQKLVKVTRWMDRIRGMGKADFRLLLSLAQGDTILKNLLNLSALNASNHSVGPVIQFIFEHYPARFGRFKNIYNLFSENELGDFMQLFPQGSSGDSGGTREKDVEGPQTGDTLGVRMG